MDELARKFRNQLSRKQHEELESTWLELIETDASLDELLELAGLAAKHASKSQAAVLLSVLAEGLKGRRKAKDQLRVLRAQVELTPDDSALVLELVSCLKKVHADVADFEQLLHKSGLGYGQELKDALPKLDRYLSFLPGRRVFEVERGPGKVKKLDLLLDKVTVDFDMGAELTWGIGAAARLLRVGASDGYFARLQRDRQAMLALAASEPGAVVALYLRDIGQPATVRDLQAGLGRLVGADAWDGFWNRARRELTRNPHVVARTGPSRVYQWVEEPVRVEEPHEAGERLKYEFTEEELARMKDAEIEAAYLKLTSFAERKRLLERLPAAKPSGWDRLFARLFNRGKDSRARALMERELSGRRPESWQAFLDGVLTGYRQNPEAFLWLMEHAARLDAATPKGLASRALDLLESDAHRPYWVRLRNMLVDDEYRLVRAALEAMDEDEAGRMMLRVKRIRSLEGYRADEIVQHIAARFPSLGGDEEENVIYTSVQGLEKARQELRRLTNEEIPRSADEIARARAHGDLSENYEYKAAKEKQQRLMQKAARLRDEVARARTIAAADVDTSEVSIGCHVRLEDAEGQAIEFWIRGPWDADTDRGIISYQSPFAGALLGKKPGESVEVDGRPFKIVSIGPGLTT